MQLTRRDFLKDMAFAAAVVGLPSWTTELDETPPMDMMSLATSSYPWQWTPSADIGQGNPIITTLNRISFGPRPGDFERVQAMGVDAYIDEQLYPEKIDDSALEQKIAQIYPTLAISAADLFKNYPQPTQDANGKDIPSSQSNRPQQVILELQEATVMRALFSQCQLQEILVAFWSNHFSIFIGKNADKWLKTVDDREVIRKHAFGKFGDLLLASASSPAMLVYLDNVLNVKGVPNENYAREIMELHSLGVNGGYTQKDVAELARAFTGWGVTTPKRVADVLMDYAGAGFFQFDAKKHDDGAKRILGIDLAKGGGIDDARKIIDVLAHHPSTAKFISTKLVRWFVSDNPPAALVDRATQTFSKTDGDIRAVLATILHSDDFENSFAQKIKKPFELVVSALRAVDAQLDDTHAIALAIRAMGQGLFMHLTPDGYPDDGVAWINPSTLLARWNYALILGANKVPRGKIDLQAAMKKSNVRTISDAVDFWTNSLLHRSIPAKDRQKLIDALGASANVPIDATRLSALVALILASPHFQYR
ncbi:MAG: DUF1800 domain-containing protein [Chloroflexi bacterium]|nr:DUF1800 domain-containing protein [Chloroflexota bacterium]